jgi:hypothetical protein
MEERFDLQSMFFAEWVYCKSSDQESEFIELVNEEKWTEEGETFMALRQTVLTALISSETEDPLLRYFRMGDTVLVDLSDVILWSSEMDGVLVSVVLEKFLRSQSSHSRSVVGMSLSPYRPFSYLPVLFNNHIDDRLVLDSCDEYLRKDSILAKTLEYCLRNKASNTPRIFFTTSDPTTLASTIFQQFDFIISGYLPSPTWHQLVDNHFLQGGGKEVSTLRRDQILILSPTSVKVIAENEHSMWDDRAVRMGVNAILPSTMPMVKNQERAPEYIASPSHSEVPILQEVIALEIMGDVPPTYRTLDDNTRCEGKVDDDEQQRTSTHDDALNITFSDESKATVKVSRLRRVND